MKTYREMEWSVSRPVRSTLGKIYDGINCLGGWVGPSAGLDAAE
jgi:hypothetical protein